MGKEQDQKNVMMEILVIEKDTAIKDDAAIVSIAKYLFIFFKKNLPLFKILSGIKTLDIII